MKALKEIRIPVFVLKLLENFISIIKEFGNFIEKKTLIFIQFIKANYQILMVIVLLFSIPFFLRTIIWGISEPKSVMIIENHQEIIVQGEILLKETKILKKKLDAKTPRSSYLVINSASNEFSLYKGMQLIKSDKCSTGSYILLKNGDEQEWMFKTPKGEFRIRGKTTSPVWKKPDWAFIEEGMPVPSANHYTRFESGVLGDYALSLGDGYLIHGTLYQRFLGLPVTHGCIRLNDANLELVYNSLSGGSKVYIY